MAYKSVSVGAVTGKGKYVFSPKALSGGFSNYDNGNDGALKEISNMLYENGRLVPRGGFEKVCAPCEGAFHSLLDREFEGCVLFHIGSRICRFDGNETVTIKESVSDTKSVFLSMNGCVYLYTAGYEIYEIKSDFSCEKVEGYVPEILVSRDLRLTDFDALEAVNLLTRRVKCSYIATKFDLMNYTIPYAVDENKPIKVYVGGAEDKGLNPLVLEKNIIRMTGQTENDGDTLTIEYSVLDEDGTFSEYLNGIYGCDTAFCYGGTVNDGTRAFLTGNDAYKGAYYRSELKNPLYFPDVNRETLGDGSERITAAQKRYEKLYFFTEKHIYSMEYDFSIENGASFPVKEVYSPVGCDMKNTVRSIDNTPVFADKNSGIYLLQSTDIFDELNVKHISANLKGQWNIPKESCVFASCDFDRKYFILCGDTLFVWDYGTSPYYSDSDYARAESRLSWYRFDGFENCVYLFSLDGKMYVVKSYENTEIFRYDKDLTFDDEDFSQTSENDEIVSYFVTKGYDMSSKSTKKKLCHISFDCAVYEKSGSFDVVLYADGTEFYSQSLNAPQNDCRLKIKLPTYYADRFSVKFVFHGARVGISDLCFCYVPTDREKYNL